MNGKTIDRIFDETAYVRTGGSAEELKAAEYIKAECAKLDLNAEIVPFKVDMANMKDAKLIADGVEIPCKGYLCSGSGDVEAELFYLTTSDDYSKSQCKGKIVMID